MGCLSDLLINAAIGREKEYSLADGESLCLRVRPTGRACIYRSKQVEKAAELI